MTRGHRARAIVVGTLAATVLANAQAPAAAAPVDSEAPASVVVSAAVTDADGPSPHFWLSSILNQVATPIPPILPPILAPPILPPPPLEFIPPPPPPLLPPPPPAPMAQRAMLPEVPVIPEADSLLLLVGGLAALGGLAAVCALRRRQDDEP
jgi:hypothetical protein